AGGAGRGRTSRGHEDGAAGADAAPAASRPVCLKTRGAPVCPHTPVCRRGLCLQPISIHGVHQLGDQKGKMMKNVAILAARRVAAATGAASAKDKVKVGFIGPLTSGVAANGIGGRNSAELAVKLRNADPKAKYEYEFVVLDDECKPNVGVQAATKMGADRTIIAAATHYCS